MSKRDQWTPRVTRTQKPHIDLTAETLPHGAAGLPEPPGASVVAKPAWSKNAGQQPPAKPAWSKNTGQQHPGKGEATPVAKAKPAVQLTPRRRAGWQQRGGKGQKPWAPKGQQAPQANAAKPWASKGQQAPQANADSSVAQR